MSAAFYVMVLLPTLAALGIVCFIACVTFLAIRPKREGVRKV